MVKTTVGAIITQEANGQTQILLTRRNIDPYKGKWCLPCGHINLNENVKDAVIREVREETGLDLAFYHRDIIKSYLKESSIADR